MELKSCPFCGSKEVFVQNPRLRNFFSIAVTTMSVVCAGCGIVLDCGDYMEDPDKLTDKQVEEIEKLCAEKWNRRADDGKWKEL